MSTPAPQPASQATHSLHSHPFPTLPPEITNMIFAHLATLPELIKLSHLTPYYYYSTTLHQQMLRAWAAQYVTIRRRYYELNSGGEDLVEFLAEMFSDDVEDWVQEEAEVVVGGEEWEARRAATPLTEAQLEDFEREEEEREREKEEMGLLCERRRWWRRWVLRMVVGVWREEVGGLLEGLFEGVVEEVSFRGKRISVAPGGLLRELCANVLELRPVGLGEEEMEVVKKREKEVVKVLMGRARKVVVDWEQTRKGNKVLDAVWKGASVDMLSVFMELGMMDPVRLVNAGVPQGNIMFQWPCRLHAALERYVNEGEEYWEFMEALVKAYPELLREGTKLESYADSDELEWSEARMDIVLDAPASLLYFRCENASKVAKSIKKEETSKEEGEQLLKEWDMRMLKTFDFLKKSGGGNTSFDLALRFCFVEMRWEKTIKKLQDGLPHNIVLLLLRDHGANPNAIIPTIDYSPLHFTPLHPVLGPASTSSQFFIQLFLAFVSHPEYIGFDQRTTNGVTPLLHLIEKVTESLSRKEYFKLLVLLLRGRNRERDGMWCDAPQWKEAVEVVEKLPDEEQWKDLKVMIAAVAKGEDFVLESFDEGDGCGF